MSLFQKKAKVVLYNENQKDEMIASLEKENIPYKLKIREGELLSSHVCFEITLAETDLKKVG